MSASYLRKYATGTGADIYINIPKAGSANHAVSADWTPAAGDVKISKDGGAAANIGTLPTAIAMGNSTIWKFVFSDAELTAAFISVTVSDSATKAVDDTGFSIETYGNASGQHAFDLDTASSAQTGDSFARLGAPAGASVSADILAIDNFVDGLETTIGAAGAGLTAIPWNAAWDAEVQSECDDAITASLLYRSIIVAAGTADSGSTTTMVDAARTEADADYWKGRIIVFTSGTVIGQCAMIEDFDPATDTFTFKPALTQAVSTNGYAILAAVSPWEETQSEHTAAGTFGITASEIADILVDTAEIGAAGAGLTALATQASVNTIDDFLDTEIAAIKAKTDQLTFTTANQVDATTVTVATAGIGTGDISSAALNEIADAILDRNMATGTDSGAPTVRTVRQALRATRNRVAISAGTATIYKEDDTTASWTAAVTTAAGNPISEVDPASA